MEDLNRKKLFTYAVAGIFLLVSFMLITNIAGTAHGDDWLGRNNEKAIQTRKYLMKKYKNIKRVDAKERGDGSIEKMWINGDLTPKGKTQVAKTKDDYLSITEAFFTEEKYLLGIEKIINYLKVLKVQTEYESKIIGKTIFYRCYINGLTFDDIRIGASFDRAGKLYSVNIDLSSKKPVTQELIDTLESGGWLSEEDVKEIIKKDMISSGADPKLIKVKGLKIYAVTEKPYAIWEGSAIVREKMGRFDMRDLFNEQIPVYYLDAFTGQILRKRLKPAVIQ